MFCAKCGNKGCFGSSDRRYNRFLGYLKNKGIRTGVISNISYASSVVAERINRMLPENTFEFIITSSNFMFRKPNKRIFDLPYTEDKNILTITTWDELKLRMEE